MRTSTVEALAWVLIYGGLLAVSVGVFVLRRGEGGLGWIFIAAGALATVVGGALVVVRARMALRDGDEDRPSV